MKRLISILVSACIILGSCLVYADNYGVHDRTIDSAKHTALNELIEVVSDEVDYSAWINSEPRFAYNLYARDLITVVGELYKLFCDDSYVGYIILGQDCSILEFSVGIPAYDNYSNRLNQRSIPSVYVYENAIPAVYSGGAIMNIFSSGETVAAYQTSGNTLRVYNPQLQQGGVNCIVAAISNLIWHWDINGFPQLVASGLSFSNVTYTVDSIMLSHGGYANANIPTVWNTYLYAITPYYGSASNTWYPTFSQVEAETYSKPCLLGFGVGSMYSSTQGHMTVCVGTRRFLSGNMVKVIDGWSSSVVEKLWSNNYNDFMGKAEVH